MDIIKFYANEYNDSNWRDFSKCFSSSNLTDNFNGIPNDIINALAGLLGEDECKVWVRKKLDGMGSFSAVELSKTEEGLKALKSFIMRMPN